MAFVLLALEIMLLFSACTAAGSVIDEPDGEEEPESEISGEEFFEEEKDLPEGAFSIGFLGEEELFVAEESKEMRNHRFFDEDGRQYLEEIEITCYNIFDSNGNAAVLHPVDDYGFVQSGDRGYEGENLLYCAYKGDCYRYSQKDGEYILREHIKAGPVGETLNGFEKTVYYWGVEYPDLMGFGLSYPDGSILAEPIYQKVEAPFDDRFILMYGFVPQAVETMACEIIDLEGNVICGEYNHIYFYTLDDGSYIGIGECAGDILGGEVICRDENGNIYEKGAWFIDKDGNKISEKFEYISVDRSGYGESFRLGSSVRVTTTEGEEKTLPIETYAVKP